tara:strand:- start:1474 stop:2613 length:1140 start_codon:yes stop_codon:yes gene_type:complete
MKKIIPYGKQFIEKDDIRAVTNALNQEKITTGPLVEKFEKKLSNYTKAKYVLTCNNGTSALYLAFRSIKLKKNDIVIMPAITFISSYSVAKILNAKVYLADVDPVTGQMTPQNVLDCCKKFKINKVKILVLMYHGGYPLNASNFNKIKKKFGCFIVEDACHALGAHYKNKKKIHKIGSCAHSDISTFSFHPVKSITTCEGGAITTNNKKLYKRIFLLRSIGLKRTKNHWDYNVEDLSLNFRLSDVQCALGINQLKNLNKYIKRRREISKIYDKKLNNNEHYYFVEHQKNFVSSNHLYFLKFFNFNLKKKDKFIRYMKNQKIYLQYHYKPIYKFRIFKDKFIGKNSEKFYNNTLSLPIYFNLSKKEQMYVIKSIQKFFSK